MASTGQPEAQLCLESQVRLRQDCCVSQRSVRSSEGQVLGLLSPSMSLGLSVLWPDQPLPLVSHSEWKLRDACSLYRLASGEEACTQDLAPRSTLAKSLRYPLDGGRDELVWPDLCRAR